MRPATSSSRDAASSHHHPPHNHHHHRPPPTQPPVPLTSGGTSSSTSSRHPTSQLQSQNLAQYENSPSDVLDGERITDALKDYANRVPMPFTNNISNYDGRIKIGQGTFGEVFKATCKKTRRSVALKKILMENEKEGFPITALREVKMLLKLKHNNITELQEVCCSREHSNNMTIFYLVFTFCEHDLAGLLSNKAFNPNTAHMKTLMSHLLLGLYFIHGSHCLHRDVKTANILITKDGVLKLADFGLARLLNKAQVDPLYTNRVVTLWYRPPELLLGTRHYGPAIDIWGAGCIMAELWTRTPILQGSNEHQQLDLISKLCGSITPHVWPDVHKLPLYTKLNLPQNLTSQVRSRLVTIIRDDPNAIALIEQLLSLDPSKRLDANKAADHPWFFTPPHKQENIADLMRNISESQFEYTAGRGAHANRARVVHQPGAGHGRAGPTSVNDGGYRDQIF